MLEIIPAIERYSTLNNERNDLKMKKHKLTFTITALVLVVCLLGMAGYGFYVKQTYKPKDPIVTMNIDGYGTVKMELYPNMAPDTVRNFISLINSGFYNGLTFHRVEADKLIQGRRPEWRRNWCKQ